MERQPENSHEGTDAVARRIGRISSSLARLHGQPSPTANSLKSPNSSHVRAFPEDTEATAMLDDPKGYAVMLDALKPTKRTYEDLKLESAKHKKDMEKYRDFIENPGQRKITIRNEDIR